MSNTTDSLEGIRAQYYMSVDKVAVDERTAPARLAEFASQLDSLNAQRHVLQAQLNELDGRAVVLEESMEAARADQDAASRLSTAGKVYGEKMIRFACNGMPFDPDALLQGLFLYGNGRDLERRWLRESRSYIAGESALEVIETVSGAHSYTLLKGATTMGVAENAVPELIVRGNKKYDSSSGSGDFKVSTGSVNNRFMVASVWPHEDYFCMRRFTYGDSGVAERSLEILGSSGFIGPEAVKLCCAIGMSGVLTEEQVDGLRRFVSERIGVLIDQAEQERDGAQPKTVVVKLGSDAHLDRSFFLPIALDERMIRGIVGNSQTFRTASPLASEVADAVSEYIAKQAV